MSPPRKIRTKSNSQMFMVTNIFDYFIIKIYIWMNWLYLLYRKDYGFGFSRINSNLPVMCPCINTCKVIIKLNCCRTRIIDYIKQRSIIGIKKITALKITRNIIYINLKKQRAQNGTLRNAGFNLHPVR